MSLGPSISDIICFANLAQHTYSNCAKACGKHAKITTEVRTLRFLLRRVQKEASISRIVLDRDSAGEELLEIVEDCTKVLNEINQVLQKYSTLSTNHPTIWDRVGFGTTNMDGFERQISAHHEAISLLVLSTTSSRVRNAGTKLDTVVDEFPRIQRAIDGLAADMRSKAGSVWTAYSDDDLSTWRQVRRDLIKAGFPSRTVRKHLEQIKNYVQSLQLESSSAS